MNPQSPISNHAAPWLRRFAWPAACIFAAILYVVSVPRVWQCEGVDEIEYLSLAHSLARGYGYTIYGSHHVLYPPLFASLLSVIMRLIDAHAWRAMYMMNAILGVSGLILIGTWMRRRFGAAGQWAAWFMLFSYYPWSFNSRFLMTEPLFLPLSFTALILAWRILERNGGRAWEYLLFGLVCFLGAMTRAAAVSLNMALVVAGGVRWLTTRRRAGLAVALLALVLGIGFFTYWSARAEIVNPEAVESHWRWARKYLGFSSETDGIIGKGEEVTEVSAVFHRRLVFAVMRYGQFVLSVVRPPAAFLPLAVALALLFVIGFAVHWRRCVWSPMAWYAAVFLAMILNTTWLSNYLRFYLVLAPLLFLFLFEGLEAVWVRLHSPCRVRGACLIVIAWAAWGVNRSLSGVRGYGPSPAEQSYMLAIQVVVGIFYVLTVCLAAWFFLRSLREGCASAHPLPAMADPAILLLLLVTTLHAGALAVLRSDPAREESVLKTRGLYDLMQCASWLREHSAPEAGGVATVPRLVSFLSDRVFAYPTYEPGGGMELRGEEYVVLLGELTEVAPYRWYKEHELDHHVHQSVKSGDLLEIYSEGQARVCRAPRDRANQGEPAARGPSAASQSR